MKVRNTMWAAAWTILILDCAYGFQFGRTMGSEVSVIILYSLVGSVAAILPVAAAVAALYWLIGFVVRRGGVNASSRAVMVARSGSAVLAAIIVWAVMPLRESDRLVLARLLQLESLPPLTIQEHHWARGMAGDGWDIIKIAPVKPVEELLPRFGSGQWQTVGLDNRETLLKLGGLADSLENNEWQANGGDVEKIYFKNENGYNIYLILKTNDVGIVYRRGGH